ncbi:MAG: GNAT family N-acetyltransferase [Bacteroidia bacterium]
MIPQNTHIRAYRSSDAAGILAIYGPFVLSGAVTFETELPTLESFTERLNGIASRFPFLVAESEGLIAGYAYAASHRERIAYQWAVETSVYVNQPGLGSALYEPLLAQLQARGFVWAYAVISLPNQASVNFHAKMGYEPFVTYPDAGQKQGRWIDVAWMRRRLNPSLDGAAAPRFEAAQDLA